MEAARRWGGASRKCSCPCHTFPRCFIAVKYTWHRIYLHQHLCCREVVSTPLCHHPPPERSSAHKTDTLLPWSPGPLLHTGAPRPSAARTHSASRLHEVRGSGRCAWDPAVVVLVTSSLHIPQVCPRRSGARVSFLFEAECPLSGWITFHLPSCLSVRPSMTTACLTGFFPEWPFF